MARRTARREKEDRLSSLPNCVLLLILSFLDMKDVICTGILSKRWRNLWILIPNLQFSDDIKAFDENLFVRFVDRTLLCHRALKIHKFQLRSGDKNLDSSDIYAWIRFAVDKGVEELDLELGCSFASDRKFYNLPRCLFECKTLGSLKFGGWRINVPHFAQFSSLTELSLKDMRLTDKMLPDLLAACPLLEDLGIALDFDSICLSISSSSNSRLKHLTVYGNEIGNVEVDAPNLQILNFYGEMVGHCSFKDMPSLVQAKLDVKPHIEDTAIPKASILKSSVHNLRHAKVLELSRYCIQAMHNPTFTDLHSSIFKTKYLILETGLDKVELLGMANLLWSSPDLETLVINLLPRDVAVQCSNDEESLMGRIDFEEREYWESLTVPFPCLVHRLKSIKITHFLREKCKSFGDDLSNEMNLVKFLLRNAMVLENITIHASSKPWSMKEENWKKILLKVTQELSVIPRASPLVDVLFLHEYKHAVFLQVAS